MFRRERKERAKHRTERRIRRLKRKENSFPSFAKGNDGPYGLEITEVDGEKAVYTEDGAYWAVYVGEEYALSGIDTTPITEGGVYKLVYTLA